MVVIIILALTLFILAAIGGWVNKNSKTANRVCYMFERFIVKVTESIAWTIMGGK